MGSEKKFKQGTAFSGTSPPHPLRRDLAQYRKTDYWNTLQRIVMRHLGCDFVSKKNEQVALFFSVAQMRFPGNALLRLPASRPRPRLCLREVPSRRPLEPSTGVVPRRNGGGGGDLSRGVRLQVLGKRRGRRSSSHLEALRNFRL